VEAHPFTSWQASGAPGHTWSWRKRGGAGFERARLLRELPVCSLGPLFGLLRGPLHTGESGASPGVPSGTLSEGQPRRPNILQLRAKRMLQCHDHNYASAPSNPWHMTRYATEPPVASKSGGPPSHLPIEELRHSLVCPGWHCTVLQSGTYLPSPRVGPRGYAAHQTETATGWRQGDCMDASGTGF